MVLLHYLIPHLELLDFEVEELIMHMELQNMEHLQLIVHMELMKYMNQSRSYPSTTKTFQH
jgi:hypothetical protein